MIYKSLYISCSIYVLRWLDRQFTGHWIGRRGPVDWPPSSPDLTLLDFYPWGHLKAMVYQVKIQNMDALEILVRMTPEV